MDMQSRKAGKFLKLKGGWASLLPLALISVTVGAFVIGVSVYAVDTLEPPTALFPDQGSLPKIGGGGAGNLLEVLRGSKPPTALVVGASYAKWADWKDDTLIGGRLGLGQVIFDAANKAKIGYPLDIQVVHDASPNTDNTPDTAIIRLAGHDKGNSAGSGRLWSGLQIARTDPNNAAAPFSEKWFIGMDNASDNLIIRANGSTNVVSIDPAKGAACIGGMFKELSAIRKRGNVGSYESANAECGQGKHVCSTEEILRTLQCDPNKVKQVSSGTGWINSAPVTGAAIADCKGWTSNSSDSSGAFWAFDGTTGSSWAATCSSSKKFACCQ